MAEHVCKSLGSFVFVVDHKMHDDVLSSETPAQ